MKARKLIALAGLLLTCGAQAQVVIVHPQNPLTSLSKEQVEQLFLGRSSNFPGGGSAALLDNAALRAQFLQLLERALSLKPAPPTGTMPGSPGACERPAPDS